MTYVEIAVNVPQVMGVFHYHLPPELEGQVGIGHLVIVPFGPQQVQGVVLRPISHPAVPKTKAVLSLVDPQAVVTDGQLALAHWLAEHTLAPLAACVNLMLPPGLGQRADSLYSLAPGTEASPALGSLTPAQKRLVNLLRERGPLRGRQIDRALPRLNWRSSARALARRELLATQAVLPAPSVGPRYVRTARLSSPPEAARAQMDELARAGTAALGRRQAILRYLIQEPGPVDVSWLYGESGGSLADLRALEKRGLVALGESHIWRDPLAELDPLPSHPPRLTADQARAWEAIHLGLESAYSGAEVPPFLLHGVTGSGKTEIYLHAVARALEAGRNAIVLVPEIALTPQTVRRFLARFPGRVGLVHSQLSAGERYDTWRRARAGELSVIVGPRSALFAPLPRLGLIVLDESHDDSYYQFDSPPRYHARQAAVAYARLCGGVCLLGSATPDVVSYHHAQKGLWTLLELPDRILAHQETLQAQTSRWGLPSRYRPMEQQAMFTELPPVDVVDMRRELKAGNRSIFSRPLQAALERVLELNQQAILFLNRRGSSTYIFCRDCGHALRCPRCETPLTFHRAQQALTCHHCGYRRKLPKTCPNCKGDRIRHYGTGTERVESEVQRQFSGARTLRWDWETTRKKGAHDAILSHFSAHRADILIGTQMLAKGLDLPLVTLVGVVLADVGLNLPDYRAGERTFQVLSQVAGRAGRSPLGGQVILQTFDPDHYVLEAASRHDYAGFYRRELKHRRQLGYPPFVQLARLEYRHTQSDQAQAAAERMGAQIQAWLSAEGRRLTEMVGPAPAYYHRLDGQYRWQILVRGPDPAGLLRGRDLGEWLVELNPPSLL